MFRNILIFFFYFTNQYRLFVKQYLPYIDIKNINNINNINNIKNIKIFTPPLVIPEKLPVFIIPLQYNYDFVNHIDLKNVSPSKKLILNILDEDKFVKNYSKNIIPVKQFTYNDFKCFKHGNARIEKRHIGKFQ